MTYTLKVELDTKGYNEYLEKGIIYLFTPNARYSIYENTKKDDFQAKIVFWFI